jgi:hypothetical protein
VDVIGELLRASLLSEVGDDQERARRVRSAAGRLAGQLAHTSRPLVPHCVVAAIDGTGAEDSAALQAAAAAVLEEWETFRNAFPASPVELLRAVTLAGIAAVGDADPEARHAAWYALRTALEQLPAGRWRPIAELLLGEWEDGTAADIAAVWMPAPATSGFRMPTIPAPSPGGITLNADPLGKRAAATVAAGNYNQFASQLQGEFEAYVRDLVHTAGVAATEAEKRAQALVKEFAAPLGTKLRDAIAAVERGHQASSLRIDLLWWRQTAYSERLSKPYSALGSPGAVAAAAAADLHAQVPPLAPVVVEHLLADLVSEVVGAEAKVDANGLGDAGREAKFDPAQAAATPAVLLDIVTGAAAESPLLADGQPVTAARAAVLLFRDLQARRLTPARPATEPETEAAAEPQ